MEAKIINKRGQKTVEEMEMKTIKEKDLVVKDLKEILQEVEERGISTNCGNVSQIQA